MDEQSKRYLAIIQFKADTDKARLIEDAPKVVAVLQRLSKGEIEQAFRSSDGLLFGYFLRAVAPGPVLKAEFERCDGTVNGDAMMVFEAGELVTGLGFSRAWTWLQRH